eukprot:jgi/Mesen1/3080/ME000183S02138
MVTISSEAKGKDGPLPRPVIDAVAGALAGGVARFFVSPLDVLKIRFQVYPHMRAAMVGIVKTRGVAGLYAGLSPTIVEIIPYAGLQFGFYDLFNKWALARRRKLVGTVGPPEALTLTSFEQFTSGLVAGTLAKVICHPLDVVKKRFQVGGLARHVRYGARVDPQTYKNMLDALQQIAAKEGMHGLYKGVLPSVIKAAPAAAITFFLYELISKHLESVVT